MTLGPAISKGTQTAPGRVRSCVVVASPWPLHNPNRPSRRRPPSSCLPSNLVTRALFPSLVPHAAGIIPTPIFLSRFTYSVVLYVYRVGDVRVEAGASLGWHGADAITLSFILARRTLLDLLECEGGAVINFGAGSLQ
jgi:hypothetical protein